MRGISWLAANPVNFSRRTLLHGISKYGNVWLWSAVSFMDCKRLWLYTFSVLQIVLNQPRHRNTTKTGHGVFLRTLHTMKSIIMWTYSSNLLQSMKVTADQCQTYAPQMEDFYYRLLKVCNIEYCNATRVILTTVKITLNPQSWIFHILNHRLLGENVGALLTLWP